MEHVLGCMQAFDISVIYNDSQNFNLSLIRLYFVNLLQNLVFPKFRGNLLKSNQLFRRLYHNKINLFIICKTDNFCVLYLHFRAK